MRLTSFTDFALRALMRLAGEPGRSFATNEIAAEFGISRNHLAKVVRDLPIAASSVPSVASAAGSRWRARLNRSRSAKWCARWRGRRWSSVFAMMAAIAC